MRPYCVGDGSAAVSETSIKFPTIVTSSLVSEPSSESSSIRTRPRVLAKPLSFEVHPTRMSLSTSDIPSGSPFGAAGKGSVYSFSLRNSLYVTAGSKFANSDPALQQVFA